MKRRRSAEALRHQNPSVSKSSPPYWSTQSSHQRMDRLLLHGLCEISLCQDGVSYVSQAQTLGVSSPSQQVPGSTTARHSQTDYHSSLSAERQVRPMRTVLQGRRQTSSRPHHPCVPTGTGCLRQLATTPRPLSSRQDSPRKQNRGIASLCRDYLEATAVPKIILKCSASLTQNIVPSPPPSRFELCLSGRHASMGGSCAWDWRLSRGSIRSRTAANP